MFSIVRLVNICMYLSGRQHKIFFLISSNTFLRCKMESGKGGEDEIVQHSFGIAYALIFVHGHYLHREANSFPRAYCELRGRDNVQGQIFEHIFVPNGGYCVYYS